VIRIKYCLAFLEILNACNTKHNTLCEYFSHDDSREIFDAANSLNLTGKGHVWILTEQLLSSPYIPQGAFGLKLLNAGNETAHIMDSL